MIGLVLRRLDPALEVEQSEIDDIAKAMLDGIAP